MSSRWGFIVARNFVLACVLAACMAGPAPAQREDLAAAGREVVRLLDEGKLAEALPIAGRALAAAERRHGASHPEVGVALNNLAEVYRAMGRYAEAEPLYKRDLAITEKAFGANHPNVAGALNNLALLYASQGRDAEAEPLARRSLAIREKALGSDHLEVANSLNSLASLYESLGRYAEAEPLFRRSLAIREAALGSDHPDVGVSLNNVASLYKSQGRFDEAAPLYSRAAAVLERGLGPEHPDVGAVLNNLALLYKLQGRYAEAEPLYKRDLAITEKALGSDHPTVGKSLANLGLLQFSQGRYAEAEALFKSALAKTEHALGPEHPAVGSVLNSLGGLYYAQDRYTETLPLLERAFAIREKAFGSDHHEIGNSLNNLAGLYSTIGREVDAEPLLKRALAVTEKVHGPNHPIVGTPLNNLALLYAKLGRLGEAEPVARRSLSVREAGLGPNHPDVAISLNTLAGLHKGQGRFAEAEALYNRSISTFRAALGEDHPEVSDSLSNLAALHFERQDWSVAAQYWRQSTDLVVRRARRSGDVVGRAPSGQIGEVKQYQFEFESLVKATYRVAAADAGQRADLAGQTFQFAQHAQSSDAATSVAQMSARQAKGDTELSRIVRERQDLVSEWQQRDKLLVAAVSQPQSARNATGESALRTRLAAIDGRLADIDRTLQARFPDYTALTTPDPISVTDAQALLHPDEALLLYLDSPARGPTTDESFLWVVTKADVRWLRLDIAGATLADRVAELRCGLDADAWTSGRCSDLLKAAFVRSDSNPWPPFDLARAHALYTSLLGKVEDLVAGKHLLVVLSGPLTALPVHALVTEVPQASTGHRDAAWLAKRHAVTVLPSVGSLKALRQFAKASRATAPFIGFGNPLLVGPSGNDKRAWQRQVCDAPSKTTQVASRKLRSAAPTFFRNGLADVEEVRGQHPLPETADELCAVALSSGGTQAAVYLGDKASERTVKALSEDGSLSRARVVHFATHGLVAAETQMLASAMAEPALILTPPQSATEQDDGLLTASEITQLRLDADWVVLSACNTAAGHDDRPGAQALSGLARAFFYAGARALLVSHWAVNSEATVRLVTRTFDELKADPAIGRAEALRRSMWAMIAAGGTSAHPSAWASFDLVGEGSR